MAMNQQHCRSSRWEVGQNKQHTDRYHNMNARCTAVVAGPWYHASIVMRARLPAALSLLVVHNRCSAASCL